jgi:hypothetical protein
MHQDTIDRIAVAAPFLTTKEAKVAREFLDQPLQQALDILDAVTEEWQTSQVLADWVRTKKQRDVNRETVTQTLRALSRSFPLKSSNKGWRFER